MPDPTPTTPYLGAAPKNPYARVIGKVFNGLNNFLGVRDQAAYSLGDTISPTFETARIIDPSALIAQSVSVIYLTTGSILTINGAGGGGSVQRAGFDRIFFGLSITGAGSALPLSVTLEAPAYPAASPVDGYQNFIIMGKALAAYRDKSQAAYYGYTFEKTLLPLVVPDGYLLKLMLYDAGGLGGSYNINSYYADVPAGLGPLLLG